MIEAIVIGLLQGLGIIWILVTLVLLLACTPAAWDAPISRYYPWWCAGWPLVIVGFLGAIGFELMCLGVEAVRDGVRAWILRLKLLVIALRIQRKRGRLRYTAPWLPGHTEMPGHVVHSLQAIGELSRCGFSYRDCAASMQRTLGMSAEICQWYVMLAAQLGLLRDVVIVQAVAGLRPGQAVTINDVEPT